ncbi:MAG: hypothetical protein KGD64_13490, partial [Candidatus Heimdallarchaeota archaeon]|nr:hypothetical protein [Candidatus Heimdallarchaeota archaeon]
MRWREEIDFSNIAKFLGTLFNADPEEINKKYVSINEMYVLKFVDEAEEIHGIMITVRDNKEPSIAELIYTAFEEEFDFDEFNPFQRLVTFCKIEYLDIIYTNTYITENSFVNVDLDNLNDFLTTFERVSMNLSKENYKEVWYDETGEKLNLQDHDYLKGNKTLKLSKKKRSAKFKTISLEELSVTQLA